MDLLKNKVAVITGGSRGLGLAIAQAYAHEGAAVVIGSRSADAVTRALDELKQSGTQASGLPCDVASQEQVQALADHALSTFGRLDIWVNNAGVAGPYGPTLGADPAAFVRVIETNILGVYHGSRVAMLQFMAQGQGKLINVLGRGYNEPVPLQNAYASSKAWVYSFTRALAKETRETGVGVFALAPGMMTTDLLTEVEVIDGYQDRLKVMGTIIRMWAKSPEGAALKAVWLASSATDGQTGKVVKLVGLGSMLGGALREGLRRLARQAPPPPVNLKVVPDMAGRGTKIA
jgi:NAD(P)-dependent dehydrogenase (short-subunit alcohol dehydrogenase family)